jgi:hypothetical protein
MRAEKRSSSPVTQSVYYDSPDLLPKRFAPLPVVFAGSPKGKRAWEYAVAHGYLAEQRALAPVDESIDDHPHTIALKKAQELAAHLARNANSEMYPAYGNDVARVLPKGKTRENRYKPNVETLEELETHLLELLCRPEKAFQLEVMRADALSGKHGDVLSSVRYMLLMRSFSPAEIHYFLYGLSKISELPADMYVQVCAAHDAAQKYIQSHPQCMQETGQRKEINLLKNIIDGIPLEDPTIALHIESINGVSRSEEDFLALELMVQEAGLGYPTTLREMTTIYQVESQNDPQPLLRQVHPLHGKDVNGILNVTPIVREKELSYVGSATGLQGNQLGFFSLSSTDNHIEVTQFAGQQFAEAVILRHLVTIAEHLAVEEGLDTIRAVVPRGKIPLFEGNGFAPQGQEIWQQLGKHAGYAQLMTRRYNNGTR